MLMWPVVNFKKLIETHNSSERDEFIHNKHDFLLIKQAHTPTNMQTNKAT